MLAPLPRIAPDRPRVHRRLALGWVLCWVWMAQAQELPASTIACPSSVADTVLAAENITHRYQVKGRANGFSYSARAEMRWTGRPDQSYQLDYEIKTFWGQSRSQASEGRWQVSGLTPIRFTDRGKQTLVSHADWGRGTVRLPMANADLPLKAGSQDKLSVWAQLGWWVACAPQSLGKDSRWLVPVWASGHIEQWIVQSNGVVTLSTPYGERQAMHLTRPAGQGSDSRIDLWFVPQWGMLPIKIRIEQANGDHAEQQLLERMPRS
ncbi:MAG: DUF3108 domain-containing protein [Alphaproteobacteria bacterium]|nr:DUF3108 domain-containing protein [Alphaproteobacteria bacterium]